MRNEIRQLLLPWLLTAQGEELLPKCKYAEYCFEKVFWLFELPLGERKALKAVLPCPLRLIQLSFDDRIEIHCSKKDRDSYS